MITTILAAVTVHGESGYAQKIAAGGHEIASDEPAQRGGTGTGPAPFELLLASLGACTAITLRMYSERKEWSLGAIDVKLRLLKMTEHPHIERTIKVSSALDETQRQKVLEIAETTPVTRILAPGIQIQTTLEALV